jgi:copper homeostasis protein
MAMVRPRGGNFVYSQEELLEMESSIEFFKKAGVAGVVFGVLDEKNEVDFENAKRLAALSKPLQVTFHKAIDETPNPIESVKNLTQIPDIQRILTSGGKQTALEGAQNLQKMQDAAKGKIIIIAAGKVTAENLMEIHAAVGTTEYHGKKIVF